MKTEFNTSTNESYLQSSVGKDTMLWIGQDPEISNCEKMRLMREELQSQAGVFGLLTFRCCSGRVVVQMITLNGDVIHQSHDNGSCEAEALSELIYEHVLSVWDKNRMPD